MDALTQTTAASASSDSAQSASTTTAASSSLFGDRGSSGATQSTASGTSMSQQAAGVDPYFVGLYDSTGKINEAKYDQLPNDLKPYAETFKKYKTQEAKDRAMVNLMQLAGKKGLERLPDDAPPEAKAEREALMRQLNNAPEKPEGYGMKKPEGIPDGIWSDEYANEIQGILHKHSSSPALAKELAEADAKQIFNSLQKQEQAKIARKSEQLKQLKNEFGAEFDQKIDLAMRGARTAGMDPNDDFFGDARAIKLALMLAENTAEDRLVAGDSDQSFGGNDRTKAQSIVHDPANPLHKAYHDVNDPRHDEAVKTAMNFNRLAAAAKKR